MIIMERKYRNTADKQTTWFVIFFSLIALTISFILAFIFNDHFIIVLFATLIPLTTLLIILALYLTSSKVKGKKGFSFFIMGKLRWVQVFSVIISLRMKDSAAKGNDFTIAVKDREHKPVWKKGYVRIILTEKSRFLQKVIAEVLFS